MEQWKKWPWTYMYKRLAPRWDVLVACIEADDDDDEMSQSSSCFDWNVNIILLAAHHNPKIQTGLLTQSIKCAPAFLTSLKLKICYIALLPCWWWTPIRLTTIQTFIIIICNIIGPSFSFEFILKCKYACYSSGSFLLLSRHKNCL